MPGTKDNKTFYTDVGKYLLMLKEQYPEFVALPGTLAFTEANQNAEG